MELDFLQKLVALLTLNLGELCFFGAIMLGLQFLLPAYRNQKNWDKSSGLDMLYSFLLTFSTPFFAAFPIIAIDTLISRYPELKTLPHTIAEPLPRLLQLFAAVVLIDLVSYWRHRIMHMKWLWPIHVIHHSSSRLNWLSTERFHILNYFISSFINTLAVQLLFGAEIAFQSYLLRRLYNFFIHANVNIDYGFLSYIFVSPRFHHWHHSFDEQAINKNYCTFFSCIDLLFGTFYLPKDPVAAGHFGVKNRIEENIFSQFFYPFKTWYRWVRPKKI